MTIHAPTYSGDVLTLTADDANPLTRAELAEIAVACAARVSAMTPTEREDYYSQPGQVEPAPTVVDDSPAAPIARLTAGDAGEAEPVEACDRCGREGDTRQFVSWRHDPGECEWLCDDCNGDAVMEE